ncbi:zinc ABC transporter substrate-binding protein [Dysgonomonas sp. Marseille-P4677]|uniref:metal ABC transporter solute-binding protein, Zn/Mn family n=1 Tax=Dysgonomonas sp. Marseille-P4677 TaxID=2364790 RepID=UPI001912CF70|nr:zinc ABC transporter substrate-binding protein [Dysgonomonas sp. Marseille-P4677]MBK5722851.1 zinc ABC transporter substrate-binding protein [Dysgonomonas sp. Marseille-P4677]
MRYKLILTAVIISVLSFWGCKPSGNIEGKKTLSVTIDPQKYFLSTIVGDHYDVNCIVPSGSNPESADFTPSQMMALDKSIAYFKIGYLGIENTLVEKVSKGNPDLKIIDCSVGIESVGDPHVHDHGDGDHDHHHHYAHAGGDPHTWSSIKSAKMIVANMYNGLLELDKANEADYTINYNKLQSEINQTDSIIKAYLSKAPSKAFIIYHPALSYFADEYGLDQYSIEHEGKNPSPSQLKELIDKAKAEGIKVVFIQQEYDTKNAETIAEAIGGKIIPLNLLSYQWSEEMIKIAKALALEK